MSENGVDPRDELLDELQRLRERVARLEDAERRWRDTEGELRQSRRMLQLVLDTIPVRVFWKDRDSVYVGCNKPLARDCGYSDPSDLVGKTDYETASAQTADIYRADDRQVMETGQPKLNYEEPQIKPDGSQAWLSTSKVPLRDEQGRVIGMLGTYEDITERRQTEEALREQNAFRRAIIERAGDGLCVFRPVAEPPFLAFTVWNPRLTEIFGYTMEEANRLGWYQAFFPEPGVQARAQERMARLLAGEDMIAEEWEITRKDGSPRVVAISTSVLEAGGGESHVMALVHDLTERKNAEEERRRLEAQLLHAQKLESLGVLAGGIAHDFNNLLVALLGNAELAMTELSPVSPAYPYLRDIETASRRAAELCRQMLAYSGRGRFVVEALDLSEVVREMTHILEVSISKKALLRYGLADGLPAVEADPTQIRQVLMNLITNASEALGERSGVISLETGAMSCNRAYLAETVLDAGLQEGLYVWVEVADTGCGMTPEVEGRMFDPFFSTKFTGRGLGMAAVLGIVRGHHAAIRVASEPDRGTVVRVLFPASRGRADAPQERPEAAAGWVAAGTVLVVDDDETVRAVAQHMLERLGFTVLGAADGREALAVYRAHRDEIACVLLDLTMPHMDGEEAFRELRAANPQVRVILSSGYNEQDVVQRFAGQGLAGFIQKPYRLTDLKTVLGKTLGF